MTNTSIYKIYRHISPTDKSYIGKTIKSIQERFADHCRSARRGSQYYFHRSIRKHGEENFISKVLFETDCEWVAYEMEKLLIGLYDTNNKEFGYNMTLGGENPPDQTGIPKSPETKKKMSDNSARWWATHEMSDNHKQKTIERIKKYEFKEGNAIGAKSFRAVSPDGTAYVSKNMKKFCKEHNIYYEGFKKTFRGEIKHCQGWTVTTN